MIGEVIVTAGQGDHPSARLNQITISMSKVKDIPPFFGEYDLIKAIALTPGINTSGEGSSGLIVRGGTPDQNLVLLDGATIYNNSHILGFISIFNSEAISSAELIKGGFSPKYGGRLSSILNVTMKEGNLKEYKSSLTVGPISSQFTTEGPIIKDKASFILSGRATYLTLITLPLYLLSNDKSDRFNYFMYDFNGKVNYAFNEKEKIFFSFYTGSDIWNARTNEIEKYTGVDLNWDNATATLRYTKSFSSGLFFISQVVYNHFVFRYIIADRSITKPPEYDPMAATTLSSVEDISTRQHFEFSTGSKNRIEAGLEISRQAFHPDYYKLENISFGTNIPPTRDNNYSFCSGSAYFEDIYSPYSWLSVGIGARYSIQLLANKTYESFEPRINLMFKTKNNVDFNLAYTKMAQPVFQLSNTGQGLPIEVWVPVTRDLSPAISHQWSAGYRQKMEFLPVIVQAELFYKETKGLIEYDQGISYITNISKKWDQNIVKNGYGKSYGLELLVSKESGRVKGWLGYTLSRNYRRFDEINDGQWYFARYDRTHDIELTGVYQLNKSWKFSGVFVLSTGQPATLATTVHKDLFGNEIQVFTKRNNLRMPTYHRLDLSFTKEFTTKRGRNSSLSFGAYNVYCRMNPFYVTLDETVINGKNDEVIGYRTRYNSGTLLTIIPYINYSIKF